MAQFEITTPDGRTFVIEGENREGAIAALEQHLGAQPQGVRGEVIGTFADNGRIIRNQDGSLQAVSAGGATTDPDTIQRIMQGDSFAEVMQDDLDEQRIAANPVASRANEVVRGTPFIGSYADEAVGMVSPQARDNMRASTEAMQRQRPGQTLALNLGGAVASAPAAIAAAGPSLLAKAATMPRWARVAGGGLLGALTGATEGAVWQAGEGTSPEERGQEARRGAQVGGLMGGAFGMGAPLVADAFDAGLQALKGTDVSEIASRFGLSRSAARVIKEHLDAGDMAGAQARLSRAGNEAMLGEATVGSRSLLDAVAARGGPAANVVNEAVEGRVTAANSQMRGVMDEVLGPAPQGVRTAADEIADRTRPARTAAYDEAFNTPINYAAEGRAVEDVLGRIEPSVLRAAIADANEEMLSLGQRNQQIMAQIADDGTVTFREMPNVRQLDQLKRSLQAIARRPENTDAFGRVTGAGLRYDRLAGELRDAVAEATGGPSGPYARAVAIGGDKIASDEALRMGSAILSDRVTRDDVARMFSGNVSQEARMSAQVGLRSQVDEIMARARGVASDPNVEARQVRDILKPLSSEAGRTKVRLVLGDEAADRLFSEVDRLSSGFELRAAVSENSRTARRQAINETLNAATSPSAASRAAAGQPVEATKSIVQLLTGETPDAQAFRQEGVAEEIARFLTGQRGETAKAALQYVNQATRGQMLTEQQARFVANHLASTGYLAGTSQSSRQFLEAR